MLQSYNLKKHANLSIFEQSNMTAEERKWWIDRINQDIDDENKRNSGLKSRR